MFSIKTPVKSEAIIQRHVNDLSDLQRAKTPAVDPSPRSLHNIRYRHHKDSQNKSGDRSCRKKIDEIPTSSSRENNASW